MVDQMRFPRWLTASQWDQIQAITPTIYTISQQSVIFPNYHVVASPCTPSRAAILTGLYPQQTCLFANEDPPPTGSVAAPSLLPYNPSWTPTSGTPGFPTIGNVLSQSLYDVNTQSYTTYDCAWIGKWHISDSTPAGATASSAQAYGFGNIYSIPNPATNSGYSTAYPSPNGSVNEANGGSFLDTTLAQSLTAYANGTPSFPTTGPSHPTPLTYSQLNDSAICQAFEAFWLPNQQNYNKTGKPLEPWFCAVSFVNAHDISRFPWAFALAGSTGSSGAFPTPFPTNPDQEGYLPPPLAGLTVTCTPPCDGTTIPALPAVFSTSNVPPAGNWNTDDPSTQPYLGGANCTVPTGKPGLQAYFQADFNSSCGQIAGPSGWSQFLNYYYWMQGCVDAQINNVWNAITGATKATNFTHPIMVVFTSDHGDLGGSHNLHSKGGALYDEVSNVPLYVTFVGSKRTVPSVNTYSCSSVDLLPFFYSMALGNELWRCPGANDMIGYLSGRESIMDAIYSSTPTQRRLSGIPNSTGIGPSQPYILHTEDQYTNASFHGTSCSTTNPQPSHAIAFRTVDTTVQPGPRTGQTNPTAFFGSSSYGPFGGGKLGMYSFWDTAGSISGSTCGTWPVVNNPAYPIQFEFYNYGDSTSSPGNFAEVGNDAFDTGGIFDSVAGTYLTAYNKIMCNELYNTTFENGTTAGPATAQLQAAYGQAWTNYLYYVNNGNNGTGGTCSALTTMCPPNIPAP